MTSCTFYREISSTRDPPSFVLCNTAIFPCVVILDVTNKKCVLSLSVINKRMPFSFSHVYSILEPLQLAVEVPGHDHLQRNRFPLVYGDVTEFFVEKRRLCLREEKEQRVQCFTAKDKLD